MERDDWFCRHLGIRCGRPSSGAAEHRWERREVMYEVAAAALALGAVAVAAAAHSRRGR